MSQNTENLIETQGKPASELLKELQAVPMAKEAEAIAADFYSARKGSRADSVLRAEGMLDVKGEFVEFRLLRPFYVGDIYVTGSDEAKRPKLKLEFFGPEGKTARVSALSVDDVANQVAFEVNNVITGFRIAKDSFIPLFKESIKAIRAYGYSLEEFPGIAEHLAKVDGYKERTCEALKAEAAKLDQARAKLNTDTEALRLEREKTTADLATKRKAQEDALAAEKDAHESELEELQGEVVTERAALAKAKDDLTATKAAFDKLGVDKSHLELVLSDLTSSIQQAEVNDTNLKEKIAEKEADISLKTGQVAKLNDDLRKLNNDKSLFAENMAGFAKQSRQLSIVNLSIAGVVIAVAGFLIHHLMGAMEAAFNLYAGHPEMYKVERLLLGRAPAVLFGISALFFLYKIGLPFVREWVLINRKRLRLIEISMLAREFTDNALSGTDFTDEQRDQVRLAMRVYFLKKFFTGELEPSLPNEAQKVLPPMPPTFLGEVVGMIPGVNKLAALTQKPAINAEFKVGGSLGKDEEKSEK